MTSAATRAVALFVVLFAVGCGGASSAPVAHGEVAPTGGNSNGGGTGAPGASPMPATRATISLAPGFSPRPTVARGSAGGPTDAYALNPSCIGSMPRAPQHVLEVTAPIPYLAIGAYGAVDLTIAVRLPDGSWLCNDDWDGLNPRVEGPFGRGRVDVFVGTYSSSSQGAGEYAIGFSEDPAFMPSMLPMP